MEFINKIRYRLEDPLPGTSAHELMMPKLYRGKAYHLEHDAHPKKGAVLILLYEQDGGYYFPLIQRPTYDGVHSGQIAFPGGRMEPEDRDLTHTAIREAEEEIGIKGDQVEVLGKLTEFFIAASNYQVLPIVGYYHAAPEFIPDNYEVEEVVPAAVRDLVDHKLRKEKEIETNRGIKLFSPYFDIQNKVVWGATAMMLSEFAEIIKKI